MKWKIELDHNNTHSDSANMLRFQHVLKKSTSLWERRKDSYFPVRCIPHYNEVSYFYDFVRPALYDDGSDESFLHHYSIKDHGQLFYTITLSSGKEYVLDVDDIVLHAYATGVCVLTFHLLNRREDQSGAEDILQINQFGRRLFPPFYGTIDSKIGTAEFDTYQDWAAGLVATKKAELSHRLTIGNEQYPQLASDDFSKYTISEGIPKLVKELLSYGTIRELGIEIAHDDRMFVLCWYGNSSLVPEMRKELDSGHYGYSMSDWWYRYLFIDGDSRTCQNPQLMTKLLNRHTNSRWLKYGTFYGASRYSFVALTSPLSEFSMVAVHMRTMYYKMIELCLVQRISLLKFSQDVTDISRLKPTKGISDRVSALYQRYIHFVNQVYFREVTAQEQGIELYDLMSKHMRIERDVNNLDGEIHELHEYAMLHEERKRTGSLELLSTLGAIFLLPTFVAGFYGMNVFGVQMQNGGASYGILILTATISATAALVGFVRSKNVIARSILLFVCILLFIFITVVLPINFSNGQ